MTVDLRLSLADLKAVGELATVLTRIERGEPGPAPVPRQGKAVVGVVGAPGVGKSTVIAGLVAQARRRGERIAVLAVDPSSPISGGALLGDRVRMAEHDTDPGAFIRSFASRGHPGGLAAAIPEAINAAVALGWDRVIVEPVGGGQNDVDIASCVDTVVLLISPESGDDVQLLKAGVLEIADILVVNKADRPGGDTLANVMRTLWHPPHGGSCVVLSMQRGTGLDDLDAAIARHAAIPSDGRRPGAVVAPLVNDLIARARRTLAEPEIRGHAAELMQGEGRAAALAYLLRTMRCG